MIDDSVGEAGLIVQNQANDVFAGNVFSSNDDIFAPIDARAEGNVLNFAAGDTAAHGGAVQHAGHGDVIHVASRTGDFVAALFARRTGSDNVTVLQGCEYQDR